MCSARFARKWTAYILDIEAYFSRYLAKYKQNLYEKFNFMWTQPIFTCVQNYGYKIQ